MDYLTSAALVLLALVLGGMTFFSFVMAPLVFVKLPIDVAGRFIRQVFPVYYLVMGLAASMAFPLLLREYPGKAMVLAAVVCAFAYARQVLMPRINQLRDRELEGDKAAGRDFAKLHRASVIINGVQLLTVFAVFISLALLLPRCGATP